MSPRVRLLVSSAGTVLVLAIVIVGLWAFTAPKSQTVAPSTIQLSPAQASENAYSDGMRALSQNDTGTAIASFQKAVSLNPSNTKAKSALEAATNSQSSSQSSSSKTSGSTSPKATTTTAATDSVWTKSLDMKKLLPTTFADFAMGVVGSGASTEAEVSASATKPSMPTQSIGWYLHDFTTNAKAQAFVNKSSKTLYPKNVQTVAVHGVSGYFGTDTGKLATVVFIRGRYVFEVLITASPSTSPASQQGLAVQAASAFSTTP